MVKIKELLKQSFNPEINLKGLDSCAMSVDEIMSITPPGSFLRKQVIMAYGSPLLKWISGRETRNSRTHIYEAGLRKHQEELLARSDLPQKTRRYMEKYILPERP